jgi:prepilin-type N-terminal cleavage/methylation domain-containing protein
MQIFSKKNKGFTLIELLVVIAIIGILSTIVLVSMGSARAKARDARRQSDIRQIATAMELAYTDNGNAYVATGTWNATAKITSLPAPFTTYLATLPQDPVASVGGYNWIGNTGTTTQYCIYATEETTPVKYFVASRTGVKEMTSAPATQAACE